MQKMRFRLALDLGSTSLGWAMVRLDASNIPCAVIKAGVRIFSDGRNPKDGSSLAVGRREARAMRRRRDRLLKRKNRMTATLIEHGFFPKDETQRKALADLNPYALRAKGLDHALTPGEFARALFHINQRRGFKSNRKTDKKDIDSGALKTAISKLRASMAQENCRSVGEWLYRRDASGQTVRARYRQTKILKDNGKNAIDKSYDLYIDRAMIEAEFDILWAKQASFNPNLFHDIARDELRFCLLFQRPLKPVMPGRCTLMPDEERAPLALPSTQRFRMYQEVNNLRILRDDLREDSLTLAQRNTLIDALERNNRRTFTQIKRLLNLPGGVKFNFEDPKRHEFKGNSTSASLARPEHFGEDWFGFDEVKQDAVVWQLVKQENEATLIRWLQAETGVDEARAEVIAQTALPEGYGSLCVQALSRRLPALRQSMVTYDKAVVLAGFAHHSNISSAASGEILPELPYYGLAMQRHVGFGTGKLEDSDEKRYGKIANPTVHIALNQVRIVVNALIKKYGHPSEVIVELARDLKQSKDQRDENSKRQGENQQRNRRYRQDIAGILGISEERVRTADIQKMILWQELSHEPADRRCPYSGEQISATMLMSDEVEIEHILPFSETLDDSLNNKTVALRRANRIKGNRTPWQASADFAQHGWQFANILARAEKMALAKRYRFAEDGLARWLRDDAGFLARALNDTRHMSRVAKEYLSLICPQNTRAIPGRMTAMLRAKFGLNDVLGHQGEKNRNDHRHHAVDACVIAVTDQGLLQRFAAASASARDRQLNRLVDDMPLPWPSYYNHVKRAIERIWVSHKPDHGYEGAMHNDTAYKLLGDGHVSVRKIVDGERKQIKEKLRVIEFVSTTSPRHGKLEDGSPKPYKGYKGDSNYCIEIVRNELNKWVGEIVSTFDAYEVVRRYGVARLRHPELSAKGNPLVMRLLRDDIVRIVVDGDLMTLRLCTVNSAGQMALANPRESNVDARCRAKELAYVFKTAGSMQKVFARKVTVSPVGELHDPGFRG